MWTTRPKNKRKTESPDGTAHFRGLQICNQKEKSGKRQIGHKGKTAADITAQQEFACKGKKDLATRAKELGLDAIHDTVHEMCKDEARHGAAFKGLLDRYFGK